MADLLKELVSGVVDAALKEVLKKTGTRKPATKRATGKTAARKKKASGGLLADILEAALGSDEKPAKAARAKPARKPASKSGTKASAGKRGTAKSPAKRGTATSTGKARQR